MSARMPVTFCHAWLYPSPWPCHAPDWQDRRRSGRRPANKTTKSIFHACQPFESIQPPHCLSIGKAPATTSYEAWHPTGIRGAAACACERHPGLVDVGVVSDPAGRTGDSFARQWFENAAHAATAVPLRSRPSRGASGLARASAKLSPRCKNVTGRQSRYGIRGGWWNYSVKHASLTIGGAPTITDRYSNAAHHQVSDAVIY